MADSIFPKAERIDRSVAKVTAAGGAVSRIPLNKDSLVAEHALLVNVSQTFAGAPTSFEAGRAIKALRVETDKGTLVRASGAALYELARLTEGAGRETSTLGTTSTAQFLLDVHYENDDAKRDLATAIEAHKMSQFDLVIEWADDADNCFIGGTTPGAASYTCEVVSRDYPDLKDVGEFEDTAHFGTGQFAHLVEEQVAEGTTAGKQPAIRLMVGGNTRFIGLVAEDVSGGSYVGRVDNLITDVSLVIGGRERRKVPFQYLRHDNAAKRGYNVNGVAFMDWGDDELGFLNLEDAAEALLEVTTASVSGVTNWRIRVVQDYTR